VRAAPGRDHSIVTSTMREVSGRGNEREKNEYRNERRAPPRRDLWTGWTEAEADI
jgi:hypothetical protein